MAYRFQSFRRLLQSVLAFAATSALAACAANPAEARVILFTLPAGTSTTDANEQAPQVWPWATPTNGDSQPPRPVITLAPELSLSKIAASQSLSAMPWSDSVVEIAANALGFPLVENQPIALQERLADWTQRATSLLQAVREQTYLAQFFRASIEAEQLALIDDVVDVGATRLEAAPAVGTSILVPLAPTATRGTLRVEHLAMLSRNLLNSTGLDTAGVADVVNRTWYSQAAPCTNAELLETAREAHLSKSQATDQPAATENNTSARIPLSVLTRPLIRGAAGMLDSAGNSLQAMAAGLAQWSDAAAAQAERQATRPTTAQPQFDETSAIPLDPAAQSFFGL